MAQWGLMRQASEFSNKRREGTILDNRVSNAEKLEMIQRAEKHIADLKNCLDKDGDYMSEKQKQAYARCIEAENRFIVNTKQQMCR